MNDSQADLRVQPTRDLLHSLQQSISRLRQEAEELRERLAGEGEEALTATLPRIAKLESLIRDCQKVEKALVEQCDHGSPERSQLDLDAARIEISRRLDRLRATLDRGETPGRVE